MRRIGLLFFGLLVCNLVFGQIVYVSPNGNGTGDGTSWGNAAMLPDAVATAAPGATLQLRQGTYNVSSTILIDKTLEIFGGFSGSGNQRDPALYPSVIDGQGSVHMIQTGYNSSNTLFDGISFINGYAGIGADVNDIKGGALYISGDGTRINNCIFRNNTSENRIGSGAIYLWSVDDIVIENSLFENNRVIQNDAGSAGNIGGGAIHIRFGTNNRIENCRFVNNFSYYSGGAIDAWGQDAQIINCHFENNRCSDNGGAVLVRFERIIISNSVFRNNSSEKSGGAIFFNADPSTITNSIFIENSSLDNGGAISNSSELSIFNSSFTQNTSSDQGGALYNGHKLSVSNSLFNQNTTTTLGGAIYNREELYVTNSTFVSNEKTAIAHPYQQSSEYYTYQTHIFNSIFFGNTAGTVNGTDLWSDVDRNNNYPDQSEKDFRRNIFQENTYGSNNLIGIDPLFQDFSDDDFSLQDNSPAVDYGRNPLYTTVRGVGPGTDHDLAGNDRLFGTYVDAGAYELQSNSTLTPPNCTTLSSPANGNTDIAVTSSIQWNAVADATGYRISIGTSPQATDIEDNLDVGNQTTYTPTIDLPENTTIYVTIVPYNTVGEATGCSEESFTTETLLTAPDCATNITPANNATDVPVNTNIAWDDVADADGYRIFISTTPGGNDLVDNADVSGTSFNPPTDFPQGETIYVSVVPYNAAGEATGCAEISFTTETLPTVPDCVTNITPTNNATDVPVNTNIAWDDVADADGYRIFISTTPGGNDLVDNADVSGTSFNPPTDFPEGETIYVTVVPYNAEGEATGCSEISFTTVARPAPPQADDQQFCPPATVADLFAAGTDIRWYDQATGGTALSTTTALSTGTYYATQTAGGMESDRRAVAVTVEAPSAPQFNGDINGCGNLTVADLEGIATGLRWYSQATGGTALSSTTVLSTGTYYASRVSGACESDRTAVQVIISITPVPDVPDQSFTPGSTFEDLDVTGQNLRWYTDPSGGTPFDPQTVINNGTYYVSQTIDGCESDRVIVEITITSVLNCVTNITPANNATDVPVDANISWEAVAGADGYYVSIGTTPGGTEIVDNADVTGTSYHPSADFPEGETIYVSVVPYNANGSASGCPEISFTTEAEEVPSPVVPGCTVITAPTSEATDVPLGAAITWDAVSDADGYRIFIGTTTGGIEVVNGEEVTGTSYSVTDGFDENTTYHARVVPFNTEGEASGCPEISFTTVARPAPPQAGNQQFCPPATVADLVAAGTDIRWYDQATGGTALSTTTALSTGTYYATQTAGGMESDRRAVAVTVEAPSAPQFNGDINGCGNLTVADLEDMETGLRWYSQATGGTALSSTEVVSSGTYYASRVSGTCESDRTAVQVIISVTPVPDVPDQRFTPGSTFEDLDVTGQNLRWYTEPSGSTPFDPQTIITNGTYYVSQTIDGCESDRVIVQINITSVLNCVTIVTPANNATDVPIDANITWDPVAGADSYYVSIGTTPGGTEIVNNADVTGTSFNPPADFPENESIYVSIVPYNAAGSATGCTEISFTTEELLLAPECTTIIRPQDGASSNSLNDGIAWVPVESADGYRISIGTTPNGADLIDNEEVIGTTYHPTVNFEENTPYYITVVPFNSAGEATGCGQVRFVILPDTHIQRTKYGISPNGDGMNDVWQIDGIENYPDNTVSLYNRWGDLIFQLKNYDNQSRVFNGDANKLTRFGGGRLPSGTYFFIIEYKDHQASKKVEGMLVIKR